MVKLQQMVGRAKQSRHFVAVALFVFGTIASILGQLTFPQAASAVATSPENKPVVEKICGSESTPNSDEEIALWNSCAQKVISQYTTCNTGGADGAKIAQCLKSGLGDTAKNVSAQDLKTAVDAGKAAATAEPKTEEECKAKGDTWEWNAETKKCSEKGAEAGKAECAVPGGIGWAICPIMTILSGMNDTLYAAIASFLIIEPQLFDTSDKSPYPAWQQFQSIANVIFIIGFIVVVYSQITGAGLSNYGVKKMLPKLIVIAILVNISYFLCQLAVDVSNLLGVSLKSVFDAIAGQNVTEVNVAAGGWTKIIAIVLAAAGAGLLLLAVSTPVLLAAFLALAMIALILIVRKALIVLLIVVSPVAFALYLLPNTEQWTKKWGKLFFSLLMLYPIIGVVFGASALASSVLLQLDGDMNKIVALGASALPLFVVPGLLKGSLAATGKLGAKMQGWGDKATGRVGAKSRETSRLGTALSDASKYRAQRRAINLAGKRNRGVTGVIARRAGGKGYGDRLDTQAAALEDKEFEENVSAAQASHKTMTNAQVEDIAHGRTAASDAERVAAVREIMKNGNHEQRMAMLASSAGQSDRAKQSIRDGAYAKGMNSYLGGSIGDKVMRGEVGSQADLDQAIVETANAGKLTAEGMVSDGTAANRIHSVLEASRTGTAQQVDTGQKDANGNAVMHTVAAPTDPKKTVTASGLKQAGQAAKQAQSLPATSGRIAGNMSASIDNMSRY